jgi:DNA replication regulator SLD3
MDYDSNLDMGELVDFLKTLVMTTVQIDAKYRDGIPNLVSTLQSAAQISDKEPTVRKRKPKQGKIGKKGLYSIEDEHVRRWWLAQKAEEPNNEEGASTDALRCLLSALRVRETQLQMIIVLEIMALEPLVRPVQKDEQSQLPGMEPGLVTDDSQVKKKKRNKHNFPVLLDVHADRLCIWQSTMLDDVKAMVELGGRGLVEVAQTSDKNQSDPLRDFCVDIIVPL